MSKTAGTNLPGEVLSWDSDFFGFRVGRASVSRLAPASAGALMDWCESEKLRCLYFFADATCGATLGIAQSLRFRFVDLRLVMKVDLRTVPADMTKSGFRPATARDLPHLETLSRAAHTDTRFFKDEGFPRARVADLYAEWISRDFRQHHVFVVPDGAGTRPAGYVTCEADPAAQRGRIGLIAVDSVERGRGCGQALISGALRWLSDTGCREVTVVTQASNVSAQRLYQSAGFRTAEAGATYHRWF